MLVRCSHCGTPTTYGKDMVHTILSRVVDQDLKHIDLRCPKCRKPTRVSKEQLIKAAPDWEATVEESSST